MCIRDRFTDSEMEQPMGDKEETEAIMNTEKEIVEEDAQGDQPDKAEARREPNWQDMMEFMAEQFRKQKENSKQTKEENKENFRKQEEQNRQTNEKIDSIQESLVKQLNEKIETIHGNIKQTMNEQYHELKETINGQREYMNTKCEKSNKNIRQIHAKIDMISNTCLLYTSRCV